MADTKTKKKARSKHKKGSPRKEWSSDVFGNPPVEIDVSRACQHGCFSLRAGSPVVLRFGGGRPFIESADQHFVLHTHFCSGDEDALVCADLCWGLPPRDRGYWLAT